MLTPYNTGNRKLVRNAGQALGHCNTIFAQILKLVPRHEFESLALQALKKVSPVIYSMPIQPALAATKPYNEVRPIHSIDAEINGMPTCFRQKTRAGLEGKIKFSQQLCA